MGFAVDNLVNIFPNFKILFARNLAHIYILYDAAMQDTII